MVLGLESLRTQQQIRITLPEVALALMKVNDRTRCKAENTTAFLVWMSVDGSKE